MQTDRLEALESATWYVAVMIEMIRQACEFQEARVLSLSEKAELQRKWERQEVGCQLT